MTDAVDFHLVNQPAPPGKGYIVHPIYAEYKRIITEELERYRYVQTLEEAQRFINEYMGVLIHDLTYKDRIKGFHLAFNIVQPKTEDSANYKFRLDPNLTADEIK